MADHGEASEERGCGSLNTGNKNKETTARHTLADWNYLAQWWSDDPGFMDWLITDD